ncbi:MAG TPA: hemerythrin domain-containing protein [Bacteroidales bacterium]|nr:hemerythrin domain-containing protein [Bacteroidales bacterium]
MKSATKNLENDHVYILRLIDVMETVTYDDSPNINDLETIVYLIKNYADGFHHEKEEHLLFPMMGQKGFSPYQGPVAVMLNEHTQGRDYVKGMVEGIDLFKNGDQQAISTIYTNMRGYISLLRNHISKENNVLFRMADNVLSDTEQEELLKEFSKVENSNVCGSVLTGYIASIEALERTYLAHITNSNN